MKHCCFDMTKLCCPFTQALVFPNHLYELVFEEELSTTRIAVRLYGGALLSESFIPVNKYIDCACTSSCEADKCLNT